MTENKKNSFIIYTEYWDCLQGLDHSAIGKIFEAIFKWQRGEDFTITDQATRIGFNFIKSQIERDQKKWEATKKKRSEAGKKGMGSRWENNKGITKDNKGITKITVDVNDNVDVDVLHKCNNNNLFKNKLSKTTLFDVEEIEKKPKEDKRKQEVNFVLDFFKEKAGFYPIDPKPRFVANNFFRKVNSRWKKARGCDIPFDAFESLTKEYFDWYFKENDRVETKRLQTVYKNLEVYLSKLGRQNGRKTY